MTAALPTFLIIGAPKAGTTSLHQYLAEHPAIAMSSNKEPMCFVGDRWQERMAEYEALFTRPAAIRGESSTAYSSYPWAPDVPERVHSTIPAAKLVYVVRDPIPRMLSHYAQNVWDELPVAPFDELMDDLEGPLNMPVWCSRYATQLERWLAHFPIERVLVLDERELRADRTGVIRRVLAFLGADSEFHTDAWEQEHNTARAHRVPSSLAHRLGARGVAAAEYGRFPRLLTTPVAKPTLQRSQRRRLVALLRPEAERFAALTGAKIDHWSL